MTARLARPALTEDGVASVLFALTAALVLGYTICTALVGPSMYADQGTGFLAFDAWRRGGPFNEIRVPDPANIARDLPYFVAWWSPGQYVVPGLFELLGFSLGTSITIVLFLSAVAMLSGLYLLYRQWDFPRLSIAVTLLLLAGSRLFSHQFDVYGGGEVLLPAATPWFILLLLRLKDFTPLGAVILFVAIAAMTFIKLSGLIVALAVVGTVVILDLLSKRPGKLRRLVMAGLPFAVFAVVFHLVWVSRGETPTSGNVFAPMRLVTHAIPSFVAPFTSILAAGDFAAAVLARPGHVLLDSRAAFYLAAAIPVGLLAYVAGRQVARTHPEYFRFAAVFTAVFSLGMIALYVRGGEVSFEDRQFRQVGLVLAIGIVHAALQWRRPFMLGAAAVALVLVAYGGVSYVVKLRSNIASAKGDGGIRHLVLSPMALDYIRRELNKPVEGTSLVIVPSGEIGLEFRTRRTFEIPADYRTHEEVAARYVFHGRVDHLGVLIQNRLVNSGTAAIVLATFKDYPMTGWKQTPLGDFTYFSQDRP